jgi:hypothetical protein
MSSICDNLKYNLYLTQIKLANYQIKILIEPTHTRYIVKPSLTADQIESEKLNIQELKKIMDVYCTTKP